MNRHEVDFDVHYYREEGIHRVDAPGGSDYIVSFPRWSQTIEALKGNMPYQGNVITTDYATMDDWTEVPNNPEVINDRIEQAKKLTKGNESVLYLGTPTHVADQSGAGEDYWHNSALTIAGGKIVSQAHKTSLFADEAKWLRMREPAFDDRRVIMGGAALICSELFYYDYRGDNPLRHRLPRSIYLLTNFAVSEQTGPALEAAVAEAGSKENYYREWLEMGIANLAFKRLSSVDRIVVADRGAQTDLKPYNAVFTRKPRKS